MFNNYSHYSHMFKDGSPFRELIAEKSPLGKSPSVKVPLCDSPLPPRPLEIVPNVSSLVHSHPIVFQILNKIKIVSVIIW